MKFLRNSALLLLVFSAYTSYSSGSAATETVDPTTQEVAAKKAQLERVLGGRMFKYEWAGNFKGGDATGDRSFFDEMVRLRGVIGSAQELAELNKLEAEMLALEDRFEAQLGTDFKRENSWFQENP